MSSFLYRSFRSCMHTYCRLHQDSDESSSVWKDVRRSFVLLLFILLYVMLDRDACVRLPTIQSQSNISFSYLFILHSFLLLWDSGHQPNILSINHIPLPSRPQNSWCTYDTWYKHVISTRIWSAVVHGNYQFWPSEETRQYHLCIHKVSSLYLRGI